MQRYLPSLWFFDWVAFIFKFPFTSRTFFTGIIISALRAPRETVSFGVLEHWVIEGHAGADSTGFSTCSRHHAKAFSLSAKNICAADGIRMHPAIDDDVRASTAWPSCPDN